MSVPVMPQPGDFRIVPVNGWGGIGIEVGQYLNGEGWSKHDHAEIYVGDIHGDGNLWTASSYVNDTGLKAYARVEGEVWSSGVIPLTIAQRRSIIAWCLAHQDVGYGWLDYLALTAHRLKFGDIGLQRYIASSGSMICSQFVDRAYSEGGGVQLFADGRWDGYCTPGDLAALIRR